MNVKAFHLFWYLDKEEFRFNNRQCNDDERFTLAIQNVEGKRLTCAELTGSVMPLNSGGVGGSVSAPRKKAQRVNQMATIRLSIQGDLGNISLKTLLSGIRNELEILDDLDSAISPEHKPTLDWVVTDLGTGSLCIEAKSVSRYDHVDVGPEVTERFVRGLDQIEKEGTTPPYFSESTIKSANGLLGIIGRNGATGLNVFTPQIGEVALSLKSVNNVGKLLPTRYTSIGSVEGKVEMITIHRTPRFVVYLSLTDKAVTCKMADDRVAEMKQLLGTRVNVAGTVRYNYMGEPVSIDVEDIRSLRPDSELPDTKELTGSDPEFAGSLTTSEYLEDVRDGRVQKAVS